MIFFGKSKSATPAPRPLAPYRKGYSLEYWRTREDLVEETQNLLASPFFQQFLSVLHYELPLNMSMDAVIAHRRVLYIIEKMAEMAPTQAEDVPITYGAEKEFPELSETQTQPTE